MKPTLTIIAAAVVIAANAAEQPELADARTRYNAALAAATKPVRDRYIQELQQLKSRAIALKDLQFALAVENELKTLGVSSPVTTSNLAKPAGPEPLNKMLPGTRWTANHPKGRWHRVEFTADFKFVLVDQGGPVGGPRTYAVSKDGRAIQFRFISGESGVMKFSQDHSQFEFLGDTFKQDETAKPK